jgi:phosphatidylglycerophosphate synthase
MLDRRLRRMKEAVLGPVASRMARVVSAGSVTALAFIFTVAAAGAAWAGLFAIALLAWLAGRLLDGLDGAVARERGVASDLGGYVDMVLDTVGYALVPLGVALWLDTRAGWIALGLMLAAFYVNTISWAYLAAILEKRSLGVEVSGELTTITMPSALVEGTETIAVFAVFLIIPNRAPLIFTVMAAAVMVGAVQRLNWARLHLDGLAGRDDGNDGARNGGS